MNHFLFQYPWNNNEQVDVCCYNKSCNDIKVPIGKFWLKNILDLNRIL